MNKLEQTAPQAFETWWENDGQEFLYALNTTTDDDIRLVARFAWESGAYCAEQAKQADGEHWSPDDMAYRPGGLSMDQEQESNSIFMEGYRIGLAEMREKCAKVCDEISGKYKNPEDAAEQVASQWCAAAIRDINFEGDTGFRPVSEMVAEHKQDPEKGAAIEKAKMRKATRAEKIVRPGMYEVPAEQPEQEPVAEVVLRNQTVGFGRTEERKDVMFLADVDVGSKLYAAPVRTKDLTDDEIEAVVNAEDSKHILRDATELEIARAVIAADREKNK